MDHKTDIKYEKDAIVYRPIVMGLVYMMVILLFCILATYLVVGGPTTRGFVKAYHPEAKDNFSVRQAPPSATGPRLQVDERYDIETYQRRESRLLNHYGWINKEKGIVHIPIESAMDKALSEIQVRK